VVNPQNMRLAGCRGVRMPRSSDQRRDYRTSPQAQGALQVRMPCVTRPYRSVQVACELLIPRDSSSGCTEPSHKLVLPPIELNVMVDGWSYQDPCLCWKRQALMYACQPVPPSAGQLAAHACQSPWDLASNMSGP